MKTLSIKVPEELDAKLTTIAASRGESKSNLIRTAIEQIVVANKTVNPDSCLDLMKDLVGCVDGPQDLSYNKKHLKGYGK